MERRELIDDNPYDVLYRNGRKIELLYAAIIILAVALVICFMCLMVALRESKMIGIQSSEDKIVSMDLIKRYGGR
jgi:hypothetical protein